MLHLLPPVPVLKNLFPSSMLFLKSPDLLLVAFIQLLLRHPLGWNLFLLLPSFKLGHFSVIVAR
jgi:hypothetical protein